MRRILWAAVLCAACSSESASPDGGSDAGSNPDTGSGTSDGGGTIGTTPLLERTVERELTCSVSAQLTNHNPRSWYQGGHALVVKDGAAILTRTESTPAPQSLVYGALNADGTLAQETVVVTLQNGSGRPSAAVVDGHLLMVGVDAMSLFSAVEGVSGTTPLAIGGGGTIMSTQLVAGHGGAALTFSRYDTNFTNISVSFARLTASGALDGNVRVLDDGPQLGAGTIVATDSGWAMLRRRSNGLVFVRLAADGTTEHEETISSDGETIPGGGGGFDRTGIALLANGAGFIAAWTEAKQTFDMDAYVAIRLAKLDANGVITDGPIWVRAPEVDIDEVEPHLAFVGSRVALTWGRGNHIYICGGCVPDHRVDMVMFDPNTFAPLSDVATIDRTAGGILQREEVWIGDTMIMAAAITFHVHAEPGTAALRCQP